MKLLKRIKLSKLNASGVSHLIVPLVVVVGVSAVGTYTLVASHADSISNLVCTVSAQHYVRSSDARLNGEFTVYATENLTNSGTGSTQPTYVSFRNTGSVNIIGVGAGTDVVTHNVPALKHGQKYSVTLALQYFQNVAPTHPASMTLSSRTPFGACTPSSTKLSIGSLYATGYVAH